MKQSLGHPLFKKQETFFPRTVFRSVSKVCGPTSIPLSKWSIWPIDRPIYIALFLKAAVFFSNPFIGSARFHMIFLLSCTYYTLWPPSVPWISWNILLLNWTQGPAEHVGLVGGCQNLLMAETLSLLQFRKADWVHLKGFLQLYLKLFRQAWNKNQYTVCALL